MGDAFRQGGRDDGEVIELEHGCFASGRRCDSVRRIENPSSLRQG